MKKVLTTILAFVYLSSSMGATIHLHYCMGKLASWGLINHQRNTCAKCGMVKMTSASTHHMSAKMDCCKDEHKQIKTNMDQKFSPSEFFKLNVLTQVINLNDPVAAGIKTFSTAVAFPNNNAPPLIGNLPLFVLYRNFRL